MSTITPPESVKMFLKRIGGDKIVKETLEVMGIVISRSTIAAWRTNNEIPFHVYNALKHLTQTSEVASIDRSTIEVSYKGKSLGVLYLGDHISLKIRRIRK